MTESNKQPANNFENSSNEYHEIPIDSADREFVRRYFRDLLFDETISEALHVLEMWNKTWLSADPPYERLQIIDSFKNGWEEGEEEYWPAMVVGKIIGYLEGWAEEWVAISGPLKTLLDELDSKAYSDGYSLEKRFYNPLHRHLKKLKMIALSFQLGK